jgi:hypothetical protein
MKKKRKQTIKLFLIFLWPLILLGVGFQICKTPSGFHPTKIKSNFSFVEHSNENGPTAEDFKKLDHIFSQKFHYLNSGAQCYAFVSDDQKYVIKFFKMNQLTPKYWLNYLPFPFLEKVRFNKVEMRERRRQETFDSFRFAFEDIKDETGLLFVHFKKTHYPHDKVIFKDQLHREHVISLNQVPFVLQKKAEMIYPYVSKLIEQGDTSLAMDSLTSVLYLIKDRCKKGYADKDDGVSSNYGFLDGRPVEIDLGRVIQDESIKDPVNYLREILRVSKKIDLWLKASYPSLSSEFQERVQQILSNEEVVPI